MLEQRLSVFLYVRPRVRRCLNVDMLEEALSDKTKDVMAAYTLEKFPEFVEKRKQNFKRLYDGLIDLQDKFILPVACPHSDPSWFGFLLTCKRGVDRNHVVRHLEAGGIQTRMFFAGNLIKHPCFDQMRKEKGGYRVIGELENTEIVMEGAFWVGVYPGMTEAKLDYMIDSLKSGEML